MRTWDKWSVDRGVVTIEYDGEEYWTDLGTSASDVFHAGDGEFYILGFSGHGGVWLSHFSLPYHFHMGGSADDPVEIGDESTIYFEDYQADESLGEGWEDLKPVTLANRLSEWLA